MKTTILFTLIHFTILIKGFGQSPHLIELPEYYIGQSVLFKDSASLSIVLYNFKSFSIPSLDEIQEGELILFKDLKSFYKKNLEKYTKHDTPNKEIKYWHKMIKSANSKKKYKYYSRQYVSYTNHGGEKMLLINLLNFKRHKSADVFFDGWKYTFIAGFGAFYEANTVSFLINLDKKHIVLR